MLDRDLAALYDLRKIEGHDASIRTLFDAIRELAAPPARPCREIVFHVKEASVRYQVRRKCRAIKAVPSAASAMQIPAEIACGVVQCLLMKHP